MKDRIIYIIESPFCKRDYDRFGVDGFLKDGYEILIWDFTPVLHPVKHETENPPDPIDYHNHIELFSKKESKKLLSSINRNDVVLVMLKHVYVNHFIFKALRKSGCYFGRPVLGILPLPDKKDSKTKKVKNLIIDSIIKPQRVLNSLYYRILYPVLNKDLDFRFIIYGGWYAKKINPGLNGESSREFINSHALDYDNYLNSHQNNGFERPTKAYAVFLDEYVPYHSDNIDKTEASATSENYFPELNHFFLRIEKEFNLKIIIAAHPRSHYSTIGNPFEGRECIIGKTAQLIAHSDLVITHCSTANNYTVLYNKPVVFINSSKYAQYYQDFISLYASEFGKQALDVTADYDLEFSGFLPKEEFYTQYKEKYIKDANSPEEMYSWEIFMHHLAERKKEKSTELPER